MKKTVIASVALASVAAGIFLYSCKKEQAPNPQTPTNVAPDPLTASRANAPDHFNVSVTNNRLVFGSVAEYRRVVENPTNETSGAFLSFVDRLSFTSLQERYPTQSDTATTQIYDEYLRAMLNPDRVIQIGNYIFRINPKKEKVYMLLSQFSNQYSALLAENSFSPYIRTFSIGDDVLDVLSGTAAICREKGMSNKRAHLPDTTYDLVTRPPLKTYFEAKIKFERYGIYFTLYSRMDGKPRNEDYNYDLVYFQIEFLVYYHVRCGTTVGAVPLTYLSSDSVYAGNSPALKYRSYRGSRNLNKLWAKSRYRVYHKTDVNTVKQYLRYTRWLEVRQNI